MHPISLVSDVDSDDTTFVDGENISNQNTIEDFTKEIDEAELVRQYNSSHLLMKKLYLCLALMNLLLGVVHHSLSLVTMAVTNATLGRDVGLLQSSEGQPSVDHNSTFSFSTVWILCSFVVLPHGER